FCRRCRPRFRDRPQRADPTAETTPGLFSPSPGRFGGRRPTLLAYAVAAAETQCAAPRFILRSHGYSNSLGGFAYDGCIDRYRPAVHPARSERRFTLWHRLPICRISIAERGRGDARRRPGTAWAGTDHRPTDRTVG